MIKDVRGTLGAVCNRKPKDKETVVIVMVAQRWDTSQVSSANVGKQAIIRGRRGGGGGRGGSGKMRTIKKRRGSTKPKTPL